MPVNSAYFQPFSFGGGDDPTAPSYDPSTDEDLDWMQYAGRGAAFGRGGNRGRTGGSSRATQPPTSGSVNQATQTALVPQPNEAATSGATFGDTAVRGDYLNPGPIASSAGYYDSNPILKQVREDYLGEQPQPNPGGGAVTSRVVGGGNVQSDYQRALESLPEIRTARAESEWVEANRGKVNPAVLNAHAAMAERLRISGGQRLQMEQPELFRQRAADVPVPSMPGWVIRDGRLQKIEGWRAPVKPVSASDVLTGSDGKGRLPLADDEGNVQVRELPGVDGMLTPSGKMERELQNKRQEIGWTGDQQARVAGINVAGNQAVARINSQSRVDVAGLRARDKGGMAEVENARKQVHDMENALANTERERTASNAALAKARKDAGFELRQLAVAESKGDPARIEAARRELIAKLGSDPESDVKRHDATIADLKTKKAEWEANLGKAWERHWSNVERLASAPSSDDGLPGPGTSGDRTDRPVPKPSQIKPEAPDPSSKVATPRHDVVPPPAQQANRAAGYPDAGQIQRAVARMKASGETGLKVKGTNYVIQPDGSVTIGR